MKHRTSYRTLTGIQKLERIARTCRRDFSPFRVSGRALSIAIATNKCQFAVTSGASIEPWINTVASLQEKAAVGRRGLNVLVVYCTDVDMLMPQGKFV